MADYPHARCMKCKKDTPNRNPKVVPTKTMQPRLAAQCADCGTNKSRILPGKIQKTGDGLFSWIPGIGKTLDKIGNTALGIGTQVAVPVLQGALRSRLGGV